MRRLIPDPFVIALIATLCLATFLPVRGYAATITGWISTAMIVILFFFHGAKLSRDAVFSGIKHWKLHAVILLSTFAIFPALCLILSQIIPGILPTLLWTGVLYLAALPSTVQSSIAFVSIARGNVPAAIASASASQILGIFMTPFLVGILIGVHGGEIRVSGVGMIVLQILVPFMAGHLLQPWIGSWVQRNKSAIAITDRGTILVAVYGAFSSAVIEGIWDKLPIEILINLLALCMFILISLLLITRMIARIFHFPQEDEIPIIFCGTKKSLVQGVPMARVLFAGSDLGLILLPIMIFHQLQLMLCAWIARRYAKGDD